MTDATLERLAISAETLRKGRAQVLNNLKLLGINPEGAAFLRYQAGDHEAFEECLAEIRG